MTYRSGLRNPRTGKPWEPALALHGHLFRLTGTAALCGSCWSTFPRWAITEGYLPRCMGGVAALKGDTPDDREGSDAV